MMPAFEAYEAPTSLKEALEILTTHRGEVRTIAGGTDVLVRVKRGTLPASQKILLSVRNIPELHTIAIENARAEDGGEVLRIGAAKTMRQLETSEAVRSHSPILSEVANRIASAQIRAMATIGGNVANASPAADMAIPLLLLDAEVETARLDGDGGDGEVVTENVPITEFFTGPGETVLGESSIISGFRITRPADGARFSFKKGGVRPAMECAVVSAGCGLRCDAAGKVSGARVAFGAVAPTPIRALGIETFLEGKTLSEDTVSEAAGLVGDAIQPISDVRGSAEYRRELAAALLKIVLYDLLNRRASAGKKGGGA